MRYWRLKTTFEARQDRARVASNLKALRAALAEGIPEQKTDANLVVGTWNIRNFDDNRFGHGPRLEEAYYYLAEIISAYDAIAVQEVCDDITPLRKLMSTLGRDYGFVFTDVTEGRAGNGERLGFIYNRNKVSFKGIAGEIVLPDNLLISAKTKKLQFCRTPFCVEFQRGWFKFNFATVHIYYGKSSKNSEEYRQRVSEIDSIAEFLSQRADAESRKYGINYLLVGDFNIDALGDDAFNALETHGFTVFQNRVGSNRKKTKFYDQISFKERPGEIVPLPIGEGGDPCGVFDPFKTVFSDEQFDEFEPYVRETLKAQKRDYKRQLEKTRSQRKIRSLNNKIARVEEKQNRKAERMKYYLNEWRTFQISDHLPLWVNLWVDFTDRYLDRVVKS